MTFIPTFQRISGSGKPRILVIKAVAHYSSTGATTYTSTTATEAGSPSLKAVRAGMRIRSAVTRSGYPDLEVYARVTAVNDETDVITVQEWIGGTPTDDKAFVVDGYVVDLPYCYGLVETFTPDQMIHRLFRSRRASRFHGWGYRAQLDYAAWISADTLIDMEHALNISEGDSLILVPRVDKPGNNYNVIYDGDISIQRYGRGPGHRGPVFSFLGMENVAWPIPTQGYGYNYSYDYGTGL